MADKNYGLVTVDDAVNEAPLPRSTGAAVSGTEQKSGFERYISLLGILNFGLTCQAGWECLGLSLSIVLLNGGPVALVWGSLLSGIGHTSTALSLAEMASMDPTVGAQYRWSARFARSFPAFWGFIQGWVTTFAWVLSAAVPSSFLATSTQALIAFHNPSYSFEPWHATLLMWAYLLFAIICNLYFRTILNALETIGGICHILFFVACIIILTTLAERSSASFVFSTLFSGKTGWSNPGVSFHLGLLTVLLPLSGYDSVLHMIDETRNPRERVPTMMVLAVGSNAVLVFAYAIALMFCIGDTEEVSTSIQPILDIFYAATKSKTVATVVIFMHMFIVLLSLFNVVASASRLVWAFASDSGLPYSPYFARVNQRFQIPLQALSLVIIVAVCLSLINLGSSVALAAILAIPTSAVMVSYFIPIWLIVIRKLRGEHPRYGPFKLGRWGLPINVVALCFCAYSAFWMAFPSARPVTFANMNYAGPIFILLIMVCSLDWYFSGSKRFVVPTSKYTIEMDDMSSEEVNKQ